MTPEQREYFKYQFDKERKDPTTGLLLTIFGLHYWYLDNPGKSILLWLSTAVLIGFLWAFIDLFRVKGMVLNYNEKKADVIAERVKSLFPEEQKSSQKWHLGPGLRGRGPLMLAARLLLRITE